jgi:hypothetical protein
MGNFCSFDIRFYLQVDKKMKQFNIIWFLWLLLVVLWNFLWPNVPPIADVLAAVFLSVLAFQINLKLKK